MSRRRRLSLRRERLSELTTTDLDRVVGGSGVCETVLGVCPTACTTCQSDLQACYTANCHPSEAPVC